jgi:HSP20 family protein
MSVIKSIDIFQRRNYYSLRAGPLREALEEGGNAMANLVRWDPLGEMWSLRQAMDRLFEDAWVRPWGMGTNGNRSSDGAPVHALNVDLYETADNLVITAPVPGVRPEDIEITVQGDVLTIKGETHSQKDADEEHYHVQERRYGRFFRQVALPKSVKSDAAEARFENGELRLTLPKAEEAKERKIAITTGSAPQITGSSH